MIQSPIVEKDPFATRVYVIGEVLISLTVLVGGGLLLYFSQNVAAQNAASLAMGAAITFWFARRQGEQAVNAMGSIADGKISALAAQQASLQRSVEAQLALQTTIGMRTAQATEQQVVATERLATATEASSGSS